MLFGEIAKVFWQHSSLSLANPDYSCDSAPATRLTVAV